MTPTGPPLSGGAPTISEETLSRGNRPYQLALVLQSRDTHFCVPDGPETSKTCVPKFQPANDFVRSEGRNADTLCTQWVGTDVVGVVLHCPWSPVSQEKRFAR